ncbi:Inner nuclear membrane protein SRC1 [Nakaseomyces glabratus]|uniref:Inner nuclear membrane protein SRC1 n=1 Tax=Candida glabrata TaxID=5478 RepID=A0A0W0D6X8_CANGB|nr:Inner nuclear membrane protein SRC1 [Nakaseomyces glabratus]KTB07341.1 Inner nuclear membrane protein SRC1 [Nakaseomyces glabratus]
MVTNILVPGFKPESLTVAKLRRVLTEHGVEYPANAKKAELAKLFKKHIKPKILEMRKKEKGVRASSDGISRITSKKKTMKEIRKAQAKKKRKAEQEVEELEKVEKKPEEPVHLDFSYKKQKGNELDHLKSIKVSDKMASLINNAISDMEKEKDKENKDVSMHDGNDSEPSSSSNLISDQGAPKESDAQPHTSGTDMYNAFIKEDTPSDTAPEEEEQSTQVKNENSSTEDFGNEAQPLDNSNDISLTSKTTVQNPFADTSNSSIQEINISRTQVDNSFSNTINSDNVFIGKLKSENSFLFDDHEEVAEEPEVKTIQIEEVKSVDDEASESDLVKESTEEIMNPPPKKSSFVCKALKLLLKLILLIVAGALIAIIINLAVWYREQSIMVGYCGQEREGRSEYFEKLNLPYRDEVESFLEPYKPECQECPEHGLCYPNLELRCKPGYRLQNSLYSLNGLIPIGASCEKDDERERMISEIVAKALELLRIKNAQVACGDSSDDIESGITEEIVYQIFEESKKDWISEEQFNELWSSIKPRYKSKTNDNQRQKESIPERRERENFILRSSSKKYISLGCHFENELHQTIMKYRKIISIVLGFIISIAVIRYRIKTFFEQKKKIANYTNEVIELLKDKKATDKGDAFISSVHLRDYILDGKGSTKTKNKLWEEILKKLNQNTNIKSSLMEVHGDMMKCLEWVGPTDVKRKIKPDGINENQ